VVDVPGAGSQPRIVWDEAPPDCEWDDVLRAMDRGHHGPSPLDRAVAFLRSELARGPMGAAEITQLASRHGIDTTTLNRAKREAGVESRRRGRGWVWKLVEPAQGAQDCH
jgi:hypothetical protein